jgi:hypothetical protein
MSESVVLDTALRLPAPDVEALIEGRMIAALPKIFLDPGRQFALYPADASINLMPAERQYRPNFLPTAQTTFASLGSEIVWIKAWARCELCQMLNDPEALEALSRLTVWTTEALEQTLLQRPHIFLAHLRVYKLPESVEVPVNPQGQFVPLPHSLSVSESSPVLSDRIFTQRRRQLEKLEPPLHPELEELQSAIAQLATTNPTAETLNHDIQTFLGWASDPPVKQLTSDLAWINTINELGTATTGGNYEKGTAFERIVHKSLSFLGFGVDPNAKGGAGGMDLYCTTPYALVGECKAGKSIPDNTVEELDRIGKRHLGKETYEQGVKLIIGPGEPTRNLRESAKVSSISIIKPMTLQRLVELKAKYPGSVNLIELKPYLEAGQIDYRLDEYIDKVKSNIKLRSHLVQAVKQLGDLGSEHQTVEIRVQYNAVFAKETSSKLNDSAVHSLLIELSSPLTGYLGRIEGSDWQGDRFYFLRDLKVD